MPPNQGSTSNGKQIEQIIAHNYFVFYSCIESTHRPSSDTTVGGRSNNSKIFLRVTKINLGDTSNERERECIFIPLKIAKRKRYKNVVGHEAIQIAAESDLSTEQWCLRVQHTYSPGTSPPS